MKTIIELLAIDRPRKKQRDWNFTPVVTRGLSEYLDNKYFFFIRSHSMADNSLYGTFVILRKCGHLEDVIYCGTRDNQLDIWRHKQQQECCSKCKKA